MRQTVVGHVDARDVERVLRQVDRSHRCVGKGVCQQDREAGRSGAHVEDASYRFRNLDPRGEAVLEQLITYAIEAFGQLDILIHNAGWVGYQNIADLDAATQRLLLVPDLEAGNMLAKNLTFLSGAQAAGIVMGARVPIILTSRADSAQTRMASCAVASIYAGYLERKVAVEAKHS